LKIISIDKPKGWTSFDVVIFLRKYFQEKKIGHLGTLDPIATGVLPVFLGKATRLIPYFNNVDKTYLAVCKLGVSTDTYDAEGKITKSCNTSRLNSEKVKSAFNSFQGEQKQYIPPFSAAKINGVPFYKLARKGLSVPKKSRSVIFHELNIEKIELPYIKFVVRCSKGTYIRSLVNDLGNLLKVGANLTTLERIACGKFFNKKNSISIHNLNNLENDANVPWISPLILLKNLFTINASYEMQSFIKFGRRVELTHSNNSLEWKIIKENKVIKQKINSVQTKVLDINQNLIAIGYLIWENEHCYFQPSKVFI